MSSFTTTESDASLGPMKLSTSTNTTLKNPYTAPSSPLCLINNTKAVIQNADQIERPATAQSDTHVFLSKAQHGVPAQQTAKLPLTKPFEYRKLPPAPPISLKLTPSTPSLDSLSITAESSELAPFPFPA